ncbi:SURF1 family protein [Plastoroseomonas hellenica]|uniref:SURF1 family protein n=1 Tax=Plastoroseomonas hellenica TaxID=2687306 RepID=UPI001BA71DC8|nr:SURF1 family protein [Plastoroseomonas hellenica]MBR0644671.1 SURF1 family protein [Plastoroseomonas hellenica]
MAGRRPAWLAALLGLAALAGIVGLTALGIWQLERRVWKHDLIAQVEGRIHAAPVAAPGPAAWPVIGGGDAYRHLRLTGHFLHGRETLVQAATERGSGYWVLTPLVAEGGFTVLVNRGFVPPERRDPASRPAGQVAGAITVTGLLRLTEPGGGFLRANDPGAERWYSRDVAAITAARGLAGAAPYFIDADATPNPGGLPIGGLTVIAFPDSHLVYALTWFALAAMLAGWLGYGLYDRSRLRPRAGGAGMLTG